MLDKAVAAAAVMVKRDENGWTHAPRSTRSAPKRLKRSTERPVAACRDERVDACMHACSSSSSSSSRSVYLQLRLNYGDYPRSIADRLR